jgi:NTP pyrophosphatase (non-canonical NTP hydrolase)
MTHAYTETLTDIPSIQKIADKLSKILFPENESQTQQQIKDAQISRLCEETGELSQACRKYFGRNTHPNEEQATTDHIAEEIGDVIISAIRIGSTFKISAADAITKTIRKLTQRAIDIDKRCIQCSTKCENNNIKIPSNYWTPTAVYLCLNCLAININNLKNKHQHTNCDICSKHDKNITHDAY